LLKYGFNIHEGCLGRPVLITNTLELVAGMPNILPLGARTPPPHLPAPDNPDIVVVSAVLVRGSIINTLELSLGIP
jgi:hypothetical protein